MKTAIIGLAAGDEGKGRVSGYFAKDADWTVKFQGGGNSGHSIFDDSGKLHKLHYLTAGAIMGKKVCIDTGAVVNLKDLKEEIDCVGKSIDLYISENVHLITPEHLYKDANGSGLGSTKKGIAYVYADRVLRKGHKITESDLNEYNIEATIYRGLPPMRKDENSVWEGGQGLMLDVDYGCYPYVTSSSIMPSMVHRIDKTIGVFKGYVTRVGDGPPNYPDIPDLTVKGNEYGATTGRPRKCYWLDVDDVDYAMSIVQPDEVVVTKMDILRNIDINVWEFGALRNIGDLDTYKSFLVNRWPQIKYFSEAPYGGLIKL